ncbi:hypothetical protein ABZX51_011399 [Aspergillus tubingensis]
MMARGFCWLGGQADILSMNFDSQDAGRVVMSSIPNSTYESPVGAARLQPATADKESGRYVSCQMPKVHLQCCLTRLGLSEPSHWDLDGKSGCKGVVAQPWLLPCHRPARVALRRWKL